MNSWLKKLSRMLLAFALITGTAASITMVGGCDDDDEVEDVEDVGDEIEDATD